MKSMQPGKWTLQIAGVLSLACLFGAISYLTLKSGPSPPELSTESTSPEASQRSESEMRQELFDDHVFPVIRQADLANRAAAERCLARIQESFQRYRQGVKPFAEDVTGLGSKWGVLRRMPGDWMTGSNSVEAFISGQLEKHVFSAQEIQRDIDASLALFREDVEANRNVMLRKVKTATAGLSLPAIQNLNTRTFSQQVTEKVREFSTETAADGVTDLVVIEVTSGVGGYAVEQVFMAMLVRIGTTAGGATVGSASAGSALGSTVGPLGTGVGVVAGLIAGLIIDQVLGEYARSDVSKQLLELIDQIEVAAIHGLPECTNSAIDAYPGLKHVLQNTCDELNRANLEILKQSILEVKA
ncbi:hypothetical protein ACYFX5_25330 [Bremerella sp. T1]|uniref:hypothetical protein n=1 Tax=Bremerella sp. TYQ1 TaxID=3119568 RepID=UPI001CCD21B9|nr:hypothetical protein [Bremerella volcania]UBM36339.1 hypothetical protein LA756_00185 [Bremerella volcania]